MKMTKEDLKLYYSLNKEPNIINIPKMKFITLSGSGDPNNEDFSYAIETLYTISYTIKMTYKKPNPPKDYYEYKVFPLEGEWGLVDITKPSTDKSNYSYKIMIQQPDFVNEELFNSFLIEVIKKKDNPKLELLRYEEIEEGLCCQMLHIGPYDDERTSFDKMEEYCKKNGYTRLSKMHKEIYISDPRRVEPNKMKTILRFKVAKNG